MRLEDAYIYLSKGMPAMTMVITDVGDDETIHMNLDILAEKPPTLYLKLRAKDDTKLFKVEPDEDWLKRLIDYKVMLIVWRIKTGGQVRERVNYEHVNPKALEKVSEALRVK